MNKSTIYNLSSIVLILLGIALIYFGGFYAPKLMVPPILTGVGFFVIAWTLKASQKE